MISARTQGERALQALLVIAPDATIELCNPAFLGILGDGRAQLAGAKLSVLFPSEDQARQFVAGLRGQLAERDVVEGFMTLARPGGAELLTVHYQASALHGKASSDKASRQRIAIIVDIGAREAEREGESLAFSRFSK